jgi:hypothetical protein
MDGVRFDRNRLHPQGLAAQDATTYDPQARFLCNGRLYPVYGVNS